MAAVPDPAEGILRVDRDQLTRLFETGGPPPSPAHGVAAVVIEWDSADPAPVEVSSWPAVVIAEAPDRLSGDPAFAAADVVADGERLDDVLAAITAGPQAATTLVQVLRVGAGPSSPPTASLLAVESMAFSALQGGDEFTRWLATQGRRVRRPQDGPPVRLAHEHDDPDGPLTARLTLARPRLRNAISVELRDALVEALHAVAADPDVDRVVLDGDGPAFSIGGDLAEFGTTPDPATAHQIRLAANVAPALVALTEADPPVPVTAEIHGACIGAGLELAAFAGRVHAHSDAVFALPEVAMGLIPGAGGTVSLPRRIGRHRTALLALSGMRIDAATAEQWGLVDEVTSAD